MGILVAIAATGLLVVPLTRWYITITQGTDELNDRLTMQTIIQDKWNSINAENYDKLTEAISTKGNTWTQKIGKDDRYRIEAVFGDESKYVDAECTETEPIEGDRKCRKVSIQITDTQTGKTQALSLSKIAPEGGSSNVTLAWPDMTKCEVHETNVSGYYGNDNGWVVEKDGWVFVPAGVYDGRGQSSCLPAYTYVGIGENYSAGRQIKASEIHRCFTTQTGNFYATINGVHMTFMTPAAYPKLDNHYYYRYSEDGGYSGGGSGSSQNIYYAPVKKGDVVKGGMDVFGHASYRTQPVIWCPNQT